MSLPVIDADGHVIEDESIVDYIEEPYRSKASKRILTRVFPSLDHHHLGLKYLSEGAFGGGEPVTPEDWRSFVEEAGFECSVLYPTWGLAMGNISQPDWACAVAHAYNSWLHDRYLKDNPRLKGMALIPLQHPEEAVKELRRAVTELGMLGAMLPSRGLPMDLGHKTYWSVYEEAEKLGCGLAVHGGCHHGMGLDTFEAFVPIAGLGHPFSLMIAFSGMVYHGVFDRFPNLRVAFLEGGAGWLSFWMDRMDRCHEYFGSSIPTAATTAPIPSIIRADTGSSTGCSWAARAGRPVSTTRSNGPATGGSSSPATSRTRSDPATSATRSPRWPRTPPSPTRTRPPSWRTTRAASTGWASSRAATAEPVRRTRSFRRARTRRAGCCSR